MRARLIPITIFILSLGLSNSALAVDLNYSGQVDVSTGAFETLIPPGTSVSGPVIVDDAALASGTIGVADITGIAVAVGGFCFVTDGLDCGGGTLVPIQSIDSAAITGTAGALGGSFSITAFSPTFMVSIPIAFDLDAGTFSGESAGLGTTAGTGSLTVPSSDLQYAGEVTDSTGGLAALIPVGTPASGPIVVNAAALSAGSIGVNDIASINVSVGGFCFATAGGDCGGVGALVPIESIDSAAITGTSGELGGSFSVTTFSPTFMVFIPITFDLDAGTFSATTDGLGTVDGTGSLTVVPDSDGDGVFDNTDNCTDAANADQRDTNGDGIGNACDADTNNNCVVNFIDFSMYPAAFGSADGDANYNEDLDINGDGQINFLDLPIYPAQFGGPPGPSANECIPDAG